MINDRHNIFSWYVFNDVRISMYLEKNENIYEEEIREIISYIRCGIYFQMINVNENTQIHYVQSVKSLSKCGTASA